jgi:hypothetical protein
MCKTAAWLFVTLGLFVLSGSAQDASLEAVSGTLVVAVPASEGLVVCADKRLFNHATGAYTDDAVKIRKAGDRALFAATNTIGFRDARTGAMGFNAFSVTENFLSKHPFIDEPSFWNGLRDEIRRKLLLYLSTRAVADLPPTDFESGRLLFNLVFYSIKGNRARSHTLRVFYERATVPIVDIPPAVGEDVRTPKLSGKGRAVIGLISKTPSLRTDPSILRFDEDHFKIQNTSANDAIAFADKLFALANTSLPEAHVSRTSDCGMVRYEGGYVMLKPAGQ